MSSTPANADRLPDDYVDLEFNSSPTASSPTADEATDRGRLFTWLDHLPGRDAIARVWARMRV